MTSLMTLPGNSSNNYMWLAVTGANLLHLSHWLAIAAYLNRGFCQINSSSYEFISTDQFWPHDSLKAVLLYTWDSPNFSTCFNLWYSLHPYIYCSMILMPMISQTVNCLVKIPSVWKYGYCFPNYLNLTPVSEYMFLAVRIDVFILIRSNHSEIVLSSFKIFSGLVLLHNVIE